MDTIEFGKKLKIEFTESQINFLRRQEENRHHFEIWPRRSGKTTVSKILILHALSEQKNVLFMTPGNHNGWNIINSIAVSYKKMGGKAKVKREERSLYFFDDCWLRHATYDTASRPTFWNGLFPDHIHMEEYKLAPHSFRYTWQEHIKTNFDKITGLSSV